MRHKLSTMETHQQQKAGSSLNRGTTQGQVTEPVYRTQPFPHHCVRYVYTSCAAMFEAASDHSTQDHHLAKNSHNFTFLAFLIDILMRPFFCTLTIDSGSSSDIRGKQAFGTTTNRDRQNQQQHWLDVWRIQKCHHFHTGGRA